MNLALIQAKKILGNTSKNPAVGCVVVKNNCLISAAHTSLNGRPHAEKNAIDISGRNIKNSELYVTLEPCSHYGKTSPCVKAIIKMVLFMSMDHIFWQCITVVKTLQNF